MSRKSRENADRLKSPAYITERLEAAVHELEASRAEVAVWTARAHTAGVSHAALGRILGMTRQGVRKRFL